MSTTVRATPVRVWDPIVRYGHWALVTAFAVAYLSAEEEAGGPDLLHVWSGYAIGIIVICRLIWGLIGTPHARFSDFAFGPVAVLRYLNDIVHGHARRYLGHSPAGAAMIFALMLCLAGTVGTGLVAYGYSGKGPLANAYVTVATQPSAGEQERGSAAASGGGEGRTESAIGELHSTLANVTLGLVVLHILGVGLASFMHRENLVGAMFSGRKRPTGEDPG